MTAIVVRRLLQFIPVLIIASIAVWALVYALPGDPASVLGGPSASPEQLEEIRQRLGLDQPFFVQYWLWVTHAVVGDFGESSTSSVAVSQVLASRIPASVQLALIAMAIVLIIAVPLGIISALAPRRWLGRVVNGYLSLSLAAPPFWVGLLLILTFAVVLRALPSASQYVPFWQNPLGALRYSLLPALALGIYSGGVIARFVSSSLSEAMESDYVRTARAKGASEARVVVRHALRNSMLPAVTVGALQLGTLLGGAVVMEVLFTYPGVGRLLFDAIRTRDYAELQGATMFVVVVFLVLSLITDLVYALLDPRIRVR